MPRLPLLLLCLLCGIASGGQTLSPLPASQLRLGLISLGDPYNPGVEITGERSLDTKTTVQFTAAILRDIFKTTPYQNFGGLRLSAAKKWFFPSRRTFRWYRAAEAGVSMTNYGSKGRFEMPDEDGKIGHFNAVYYDSFTVQKRTAFANLRIGIQGVVRRFVMDASIGLGPKYKKTAHTGRAYGGVLYPGLLEVDAYQIADREMAGLVLNVPMSVGIGYAF